MLGQTATAECRKGNVYSFEYSPIQGQGWVHPSNIGVTLLSPLSCSENEKATWIPICKHIQNYSGRES
jgi:hypothetical protein